MNAWERLAEMMEGPLDWKRSFKKAQKALGKTGQPGVAQSVEVPKAPGKPPQAKPARAGGPEDDPLKTSTNAELFQTDAGDYFYFRDVKGRHHAIFVTANHKKVEDLGEHPGRKEAIDAVLHHHDKTAAGIGEQADEER